MISYKFQTGTSVTIRNHNIHVCFFSYYQNEFKIQELLNIYIFWEIDFKYETFYMFCNFRRTRKHQ